MRSRIIVLPEELQQVVDRLEEVEKILKKDQRGIEDPVLDTEGVMNLLHVSRRCMQSWRDNGIIEYSGIGGKFYYRLSAINKMLDNHLKNKQDYV